ncbi:aldo/keto reductase [Sphingosinicella sp. CPCC 101087]|uniref:aldo/keto reductase n=1 Tax=Sphingosinicella sp. CPCC 101087 TaxID=2497754 RepID=UPI00101D3E31|nr:aldo/keto reductase [Sphingosinicella sp. CPCC 101087]
MAATPERRLLGGTPFEIAPLMFGGNVFGWTVDEATSFALLDRFVDAGFNAVDTADVYSGWIEGNEGGESETIIGNWLAQGGGRRDRIVLATKVGMEMAPDRKGLARDYIIRAAEDSLRRLRTDRIDLYQSHRADESVPIEETLRAYEELIASGKVRAIGASNYSAAQLGAALDTSEAKGLPRYETLQPLYNLYDRAEYEGELERLCEARGLGVIPFFGLASGFLTGKYRSQADLAGRPRGQRVQKYLNTRGLRILGALDAVGAELDASPAQVALAWLMARPSITAPIASATSIAQLDELIRAAALTLDPGQIATLDTASADEERPDR